jgi:hypothetical protein
MQPPATGLPPGTSFTELNGVSCPSVTMCIAVGRAANAPLVERWNGTGWAAQSQPPVAAILAGVSCTTATNCVAVGFRDVDISTPDICPGRGCLPLPEEEVDEPTTFAESLIGNTWLIEPTAGGGGVSALFGASCEATNKCPAVGYLYPGGPTVQPLANQYQGFWYYRPVPSPKNATDTGLTAVSCGSSTACQAVGGYAISTPPYYHTLAEVLGSNGWHIEPTP